MASAVAVADPAEEAQVAAGKENKKELSPIVQAITDAERASTGEIRVHLSRRWIEKDPFDRAFRLFHQFGMTKTRQRNAVLLYINLRKKKFAIVGDEGIHHVVGQRYWEELALHLKQDLQSTHIENAVALAVRTIGMTLKKFFPVDLDGENHDELPNEVTEDT